MVTDATGPKLIGAWAGLSGFLTLMGAPFWLVTFQGSLLGVALLGIDAILGLLFLVVGAGLYVTAGWARLAAMALFGLSATLNVLILVFGGSPSVAIRLAVTLVVLGYLYLNADAFGGAAHADIDADTSAHEIGINR